MLPFDRANEKIWSIGAEIFVPAAASRLLSKNQLDQMRSDIDELKDLMKALLEKTTS